MVFSSLEFIYLFMPPVLFVFYILRHLQWEKGIIWWLIASSVAFYAWWSPIHLILLLGSVVVNFALHKLIQQNASKLYLTIGIIGNLATLAYFKYADFLIANFNLIAGVETPLLHIVLPLAISFFTFQQISFLYDTYIGQIEKCDFAKYCLFVVFFPQLIAGPIVLQKHTIPQFMMSSFNKSAAINISVGATLFVIGLFKKIVLADGIAPIVNTVFNAGEAGHSIPFEAAWMGTIAYTFQIYFDFSGYCDMALGLARIFGIRLPINFNSPYKAVNIVDFWRRWHITLSAFLRNYLYIPLGGNKKGLLRRYINLSATMLLGGLWHGASWNFVFWGLLHGCYLIINHAWTAFFPQTEKVSPFLGFIERLIAQSITLLAVMVAWVFFRAESFGTALAVLKGMFGQTLYYDAKFWSQNLTNTDFFWFQAIALAFIVIIAPNSIEIVRKYRPVVDVKSNSKTLKSTFIPLRKLLRWRPSLAWSASFFVVGIVSLVQIYRLDELTEFIYFNF